MAWRRTAAAPVICLTLAACGGAGTDGPPVIRAGHFPNVTHAQALVGHSGGAFQKAFDGRARVEWKVFNAGPSAIEAIFAGALDLTYIGPNPAITGYVRSQGEALRVVAGACSGGSALVVRGGLPIETAADFAGRSLATPQIGNTQDVAARHWLLQHGLDWLERGGTVRVLPLANPDHLTLFLKNEIDASWTVEPWVSRLEQEAGGRILLEEKELWPDGRYVTTHLVASTRFIREHPDLLKLWIAEHVRLTGWINAHTDEAIRLINEDLVAELGRGLPDSIIRSALSRLELTDDPVSASLVASADRAFALGFLGREKPDLSGIYDLRLLEEVRAEVAGANQP